MKKASFADAAAKISSLKSKIDDLSTSIATSECEHLKATNLRAKQHADFIADEKQMLETMESLNGATA